MENEKKKSKIGLLFVSLATLLLIGVCTYAIFNYTKPFGLNDSDIEEFKEEYESLNGKQREDSDTILTTLEIDDKLEVYYKSDEEILDIINNEKAIIYFGFSDCPWCRAMIETLASAVVDKEKKLYYVDISEIRNVYAYENGEVIETNEGSDSYYELLKTLDDYLPDYNVKNEDGEIIPTNTKRIYAPTIITVKNGNVMDLFSPGSENISDPSNKVTDKEANDLYTKFLKLINDLDTENCDITSTGC